MEGRVAEVKARASRPSILFHVLTVRRRHWSVRAVVLVNLASSPGGKAAPVTKGASGSG